jgi:hypothetical protein
MPTAVLPGLTCARPASLRIGSDTAVAPELNSPMYPMAESSPAALSALADVALGSQPPAWAVESSSDSYLMVNLPALPPDCSSASLAPLTAASDCARAAPCSGRLE